MYKVVSLFSGCGGLDLGFKGDFYYLNHYFKRLKFKIIYAIDINKDACLTYKNNFNANIICDDIKNIAIKDLPQADIVIGGFPCQDFSYAGKRRGLNCQRGLLYKNMCSVIQKLKPALFLAENVKGILTIENGRVISNIINDFEKLGYNVVFKLLKVSNYGVAQKRERVIIIGTNKDYYSKFNFDLIEKNFSLPVFNVIQDLENFQEGAIQNHYWSKAKKNKGQGNSIIKINDLSPTIRAEHHGNIEFHYNGKRRLSVREVARIQSFPDNFIFYPSMSSSYKQIGNAVPPVFAWHISKAIEKFLNQKKHEQITTNL